MSEDLWYTPWWEIDILISARMDLPIDVLTTLGVGTMDPVFDLALDPTINIPPPLPPQSYHPPLNDPWDSCDSQDSYLTLSEVRKAIRSPVTGSMGLKIRISLYLDYF